MSDTCTHPSADGLFTANEDEQMWWCWSCGRIYRSETEPEGISHDILVTYDELRFRIDQLEQDARLTYDLREAARRAALTPPRD